MFHLIYFVQDCNLHLNKKEQLTKIPITHPPPPPSQSNAEGAKEQMHATLDMLPNLIAINKTSLSSNITRFVEMKYTVHIIISVTNIN